MLSDQELLHLKRTGESEQVEIKPSTSQGSSIRRAVCAFANDLAGQGNGGVVLVGLERDGSCAHIEDVDRAQQLLANWFHGGDILPLPDVEIYCREQERRLVERRRGGVRPFDGRPAQGASMAELDLDYFEREYLPNAVATDVLEENQRSVDDQLRALRMLTDGLPNYGAMLILGLEPTAYIPGAYLQFLRIDGRELGDPIKDEKNLSGNLPRVMAQLDELLDVHVQVAVDIESSAREHRHPDYPVVALQQLARNALIHRTYEATHAPVRIYWFNDRIEIHNPGGLYGQVTRENFGQGVTDYRNPLIAEAMHVLGYVQRFGFGVPLARRHLRGNNNPEPEFHFEATYVAATVRAAK